MKLIKTVAAAAAAVCLAVGSVSARADVTLTIDDLSTAGVDWSSGAQAAGTPLVHVGSVGTWALDVTTGLGNGWSDIFGIDLNSIAASSRAGGTLRITFTETNLNAGFPNGPLSITSAIGGTTQGTVTYKSWFDDSNAAFGQGELLFSGSSSALAFADAVTTVVNASDPFSLTLQVDVTHVGAKTTSFDFSATVPEPSTVALLGVALLGAGAASRRRNKKA